MAIEISTLWECPNCTHQRTTGTAAQHAVIHNCTGLGGLIAPMVRAGTKCKVEAVEREDYVGSDRPQVDSSGKPIMAIRTTRDDGIDVRILAPTALGGGR